jgi:hypothetical protein
MCRCLVEKAGVGDDRWRIPAADPGAGGKSQHEATGTVPDIVLFTHSDALVAPVAVGRFKTDWRRWLWTAVLPANRLPLRSAQNLDEILTARSQEFAERV